jgi:MFS family permease
VSLERHDESSQSWPAPPTFDAGGTLWAMVSVADELVRRKLAWKIFVAAALGTTAFYGCFTAAALAAVELMESRAYAGIPGALSIAGAGVGAAYLSPLMARRGRRVGLTVGWTAGLAGAVVALLGVEGSSFLLLTGGMIGVGTGHGANQLARFAAADTAQPSRRGAVLSRIVWAGTLGAAIGPSLLELATPITDSLRLDPLSGIFVVSVGLYGGAALIAGTLRPDPSSFSQEQEIGPVEGSSLKKVIRLNHVALAVSAMVSAQVAMIVIMSMTPVHLRDAHHEVAAIGLVMSAHFVGMFGLAPLAGKAADRLSSAIVIYGGLFVVALASVAAALSPADAVTAVGASLVFLGVGWSFTFVGGSTLLTRGLSYAQRVRLQGGVDAIIWLISAIGSVAAGAIIEAFGFAILCVLAAALVALPLLAPPRRALGRPA